MNTVGAQTLKLFYEHPIFSEVISDREAVSAIEKFVGTYRGTFRPSFFPPRPRIPREWKLKLVRGKKKY